MAQRNDKETKTLHPRRIITYIATPKWQTLRVDDNDINHEVAQGLLKKPNLNADAATNRLEVLHMLQATTQTNPYDIFLRIAECRRGMVMTLHGRIEEAKQVKWPKDPRCRRDSESMQADRLRCLSAGMNDYLSKPVGPLQSKETLKKWLPHKDT